ncbi:prolyl endopeptidase [Salpingoeca rosetta]|uniref:Prolyl endopeptidase n=1 Tax=Salpingoeca rosetta (strain ATCC 50818 / BSB-021) TaxID=946362 RepID=F2U9E8_SALR5|nr:prolyl endopeptidase [Salpingoeca rosetta]EGD73351.1 prolyl endopeptidase [Salpingoeca rosetta]|eukprot:XP_004994381.1 prolyl endopeptidase [Salpingoeca rosetta]
MSGIKYPQAERGDVVEDFHGTKVADPYKWLEDPDAEKTQEFVKAQNDISSPFIDTPFRKVFLDRLKEVFDFPKHGCPFRRGTKYYYFFNTGLQNQAILYQKDSLDGEPRVFLDPNELSEDGTTAITGIRFSKNDQYMAYNLSKAGSDWSSIKVRDTETGKDLDDELEWVKFSSVAWTHDNEGFFYNRYNKPNKENVDAGTETDTNVDQKLYYHRLHTPQSEDVLCYETPDHPKWMIHASVTEDGKYFLLYISEGCKPANRVYVAEAAPITGMLQPRKLIDNFDADYSYIANDGSIFTFKTNLNAPRSRIVRIDISKDEVSFDELVPETKDVLETVRWIDNDKMLLNYVRDVKDVLQLHALSDGSLLRPIELDVGSLSGIACHYDDSELFYQFTSFLTPGIIYRADVSKPDQQPSVFYETKVEGFNAHEFVTEQVFYDSKDGTKIPMFIVHRKGIQLDGSNPTLLYGYGGFSISLTPFFSVSRTIFCGNMGGVFALANIRGGNEYGEDWHKAGTLENKQNCFDDFQAAAEYLIANKYTCAKKLAIQGGSNGGLLVAACANQRPELYGAVIAQVGVMDMLHFHKFTIGHAWTTDFGCADDPEQFKWLIKYSPIHNVKHRPDAQYPAMLLLTADHDDRVVPLHTLKLIATLQHELGDKENQTNPLLARIEVKAGHGAGKPTQKRLEEMADVFAFMAKTLDIQWTPPASA